MKIVQSYWTKPSFKKKQSESDRSAGGWLDIKYNYLSWALSCLQLKKFYNEVELVTDEFGFELLVNKLNLPYSNVKVILDDLNEYNPDLWALGKIYAYSVQEEPFLHVDGDIYIWERFAPRIENAALVCQNLEEMRLYDKVFNQITKYFNFIPLELLKSKNKNGKIKAANAGILGGTDIAFFKNYTEKAFQFVNNNLNIINKMDVGLFNMIFEQSLFYALSEDKKIDLTFLFPNMNEWYDGIADFTGVPDRVKYIHAIGFYKQGQLTCDFLELKLQQDYPDYYYRIKRLLYTHEL